MNQALINEYKGYLFEFLVGKSFASNSRLGEVPFLNSISKEQFTRLESYQNALYVTEPVLYRQLPLLATATVDYYLQKSNCSNDYSVELISRSLNHETNADLVLVFANTRINLSLKLVKDQVYVNTLSAGIKSFFSKYFKDALDHQNELNTRVLQAFEKMRFHLLDHYGHELSGKLFEQWRSAGNAILPSQLDEELRQYLLEYYHTCISTIFVHLKELYKSDTKATQVSLRNLCGLGADVNHLFCFHHGTESYKLSRIVEMNSRVLGGQIPKIIPPARGSSYFLIDYHHVALQIRVKPMRDFTTFAMKINCALKIKKKKK